jgi:hypothetical protein
MRMMMMAMMMKEDRSEDIINANKWAPDRLIVIMNVNLHDEFKINSRLGHNNASHRCGRILLSTKWWCVQS